MRQQVPTSSPLLLPPIHSSLEISPTDTSLCAVQDYAGVTRQPVAYEEIYSPPPSAGWEWGKKGKFSGVPNQS